MAVEEQDVIERLNAAIEDWAKDIASSHSTLAEQIGTARGLLEQLSAGEEVPALPHPEVERLTREVEELKGTVSTLQAETSTLREESAALREENSVLREAAEAREAALVQEAQEARDERDHAEAALEGLRTELKEARAEVRLLEQELDERRARDEEARQEPAVSGPAIDATGETAPALDSVIAAPIEEVTPGAYEAFDPDGHKKPIGSILVDADVVTEEQLKEVLAEQGRSPHRRLGALLVERGFTTEDVVARVLAAQLRLPVVRIGAEEISENAVALVSEHLVRLHHCVPLRQEGDNLLVAMVNPLDLIAIEDLELASGKRVEPVVATPTWVEEATARFYPAP